MPFKSIFIVACLFMVFSPSIYAVGTVETRTIKGIVVDTQQHPVEVGNVVILSNRDSSIIHGDMFLDGQFMLEGIDQTDFILHITALGYQDYYRDITIAGQPSVVDIGIAHLSLSLLNGVEITATQNMIEQRGTDLIVNVENTALSNAGTVLDVIRNAPKVISSQGGGLSIIGKGNAVVYLNGQQIASTQILSNLSSTDVQRIEIIENPGAKYDAAGNAVINVITKSKSLEGYKLGLLQRASKAKHYRSYFQANGYYKINKLMLQGSYGIRPWTWGSRFNQVRDFTGNNFTRKNDNWNINTHKRIDHDMSLRTTYDVNQKNLIGIQYTAGYQNGDKVSINDRIIYDQEDIAATIATAINGPYNQSNHTINTYWIHNRDTLGSSLKLSGQYSNFGFDRNDNSHQITNISGITTDIDRRSNNLNDIKVYAIQLDINKISLSGLQWDYGLKNAYVTNNSLVSLSEKDDDENYTALPQYTNTYNYSEYIASAYTSLSWLNGKTKYTAGLRSEWTMTDGSSTALGEHSLQNKYLNLFPSASISKTFSDNVNVALNYSYRINRPVFQDLNPYLIYVDSLVALQGNPNLTPEYSHSLSANIGIKKLNIGLSYNNSKDKINQIFRSLDADNPNSITFVKENLNRVEVGSISLSYPIYTSKVSGNITLGGFYDSHQIQDQASIFKNTKTGYYIQAWSSFQLPWKVKFDVNFSYFSPRVDGVYIDDPVSYLHMTLSKSFFQNHLMFRVRGNDVYQGYKFTGIADFNNMHMNYLSEGDWQVLTLSLNWDFGKLNTNKMNKGRISRDELNRINSNQ